MSIDKMKVASMKVLSPIITEALDDNSCIKLVVTGNSMYPLFRSDVDTVILKKKTKISKYDILLYQRQNGDYILHRVVDIKGDALCMAGDYEIIVEYPIYKNQVIAAVESFYRNGKYISCRNLIYKLYSILWYKLIFKRHKIISLLKRLRNAVRCRR